MIYEFGEFQIDKGLYELRRADQVLSVQRTVLAALVYLIEHCDRTVTKDELIAGPWHGVSVSDGSISQAVMLARKALEDDGASQRYIKTVRGVGYRFVAPVSTREGTSAAPSAAASAPSARSRSEVLEESAPPPCGRASELAELVAGLEAAQAGQGGVILLAGPPGIGKTYLCEHVTRLASDRGLPVLWGRSWEGGGAPAFWPWTQVFRRLLVDPELDAAAEVSPREVEHLIQLLPEIADCFPEARREAAVKGEGAKPHQLFETASNVLQRIARRQDALTIVLDDLHASDVSSVALLDYLAKGLRQSHLWVIGTYREVELRSAEPVAALIAGLHGVRGKLALDGLSETDVAVMLGAQDKRDPGGDDWVRRIHRVTAGNPLFLQEVKRLVEAEHLVGAAVDKIQLRIPGRIAEAMRRHVRKLPESTRQLLELAAVIGPDFALPLLQTVTSSSGEEALTALSLAIDAGLIHESYEALAHYRFSHDLIRNTIYGDLSAATRAGLHRRVAEALERLDGAWNTPYSQLAHHFFAAAALGTAGKAVTFAIKAGDKAMASTAYVEAIAHYGLALQALELMPDALQQRGDALLRLGGAYRASGRTDDAMQTYSRTVQLAREARLPKLFAQAALGHGFTWRMWTSDATVIAWLEEALELLDDKDSKLRARVMARLAASLWFSGPSERERRERLSDAAVAMARRLDDPSTLALALICAHTATNWGSTTMEKQLESAEQIIASAQAAPGGAHVIAQEGRLWRIAHLSELGRFAETDREIARYAKLATLMRSRMELSWVARWKAMRATMLGEVAEALTFATEAYELGRRAGDRNASPFYFEQRHIIETATGTPQDDVARALHVAERNPDLVLAQLRLARAYCDVGADVAAERVLRPLIADDFAQMPDNNTRFSAFVAGALVCAHLMSDRAAAAARKLYALLLPEAERILTFGTGAVAYGPAHQYLGLFALAAGERGTALEHFIKSEQRAQAVQAPLWILEAQLAQARARIALEGKSPATDALVQSARAVAESLQLRGFVERCRVLLS